MAEEQQQSPPRREIVTGVPRGARRRPPAHTPARSEISEQTTLGATYVRALMRSQLRVALGSLAGLVALIGTLPLVFALCRDPSGPLVWVALGVLVYPVMWLIARWYVTRAERNEADFTGLVMDPADRG
ncbi:MULTISPECIES: membrane protein [unclassified Streptomyces]|uniref:membrane protein n=1 Tax=unclassified Streptomyces TaxID=2593676 RepID=UPI0004BD949C|nr:MULTISPECIES: membrane protein [unclassified Streptomyces]